MSYSLNTPELEPDLIYPAFTQLRAMTNRQLLRFDHQAVNDLLENGSPVAKVAMPWAWVTTAGESACLRVNVTRVGMYLAGDAQVEITRSLGAYAHRLTHLLGRDLLDSYDNDLARLNRTAQDLPVLELPTPLPRDLACVEAAMAATGLTLGQLHSRILMRSLH